MLQKQQIADQRAQRQRLGQVLGEHPRPGRPVIGRQLQHAKAQPVERTAQHQRRHQHDAQPRDPLDQIIAPLPPALGPRRHAARDPVAAQHEEQDHRRMRKAREEIARIDHQRIGRAIILDQQPPEMPERHGQRERGAHRIHMEPCSRRRSARRGGTQPRTRSASACAPAGARTLPPWMKKTKVSRGTAGGSRSST
jgi:hypothetical protein